jgi:hypothetical protein
MKGLLVKRFAALCLVLLTLFSVATAGAATLKIAVPEFKIIGAANQEELKSTLQTIFASRLKSDILKVAGPGEVPDLTVNVTYTVFGKVFSLDAIVVNSSGKIVGRGFEQGESADEIIPALSRLAQQFVSGSAVSVAAVAVPTAPIATPNIEHPGTVVQKAPEGDIIKPDPHAVKSIESGMIGQRLEGVIIGVAEANRGNAGERQLVAALSREIRLYSQGEELKLLRTLKDFGENDKVVAIDSADLDADGIFEIYVTVFRGEELSSRVYLIENGGFRLIAADLPYFFRGMSLKGGAKKVYAQEMGREDDYYDGLHEVVKTGDTFKYDNQLKLPRPANIFNTNMVTGRKGELLFIVIHPDNYLLVYDEKGELLWKSSDKYGGSETYFSRDDSQNQRITGSKFRRSFLEQRITVTKSGVIIIPKNEGFFVVGDSRSFTKSSIYAFKWNGASLDELWHTKVSQNYLSDYLYDESRKELLLAEVVKKEGVIDKGASAISIKRVE